MFRLLGLHFTLFGRSTNTFTVESVTGKKCIQKLHRRDKSVAKPNEAVYSRARNHETDMKPCSQHKVHCISLKPPASSLVLASIESGITAWGYEATSLGFRALGQLCMGTWPRAHVCLCRTLSPAHCKHIACFPLRAPWRHFCHLHAQLYVKNCKLPREQVPCMHSTPPAQAQRQHEYWPGLIEHTPFGCRQQFCLPKRYTSGPSSKQQPSSLES